MNDETNLIRKAKLKLFTNVLIFFGMCAHKFEWSIYEFDKRMEAFVYFNREDLSKIESGTIHINKHYTSQIDYTYENLVFVICHELLHVLNKHGLRKGDRIPEIWNVATDHVIEEFLKYKLGNLRPYKNRYNIIQELYNKHPNCTAEFAYDWLMANTNIIKISIIPGDGIEPDMIEVTDQNGNILFTTDMNMGGTQTNGTEDPQLQHQIEQFVSEARAILENIKQKGNVPGNLLTYLTEILKVEIPWERLVEKAIKTNVVMKPDDRSWRQLNKMFIPHHLTLPGYSLVEENEGTGKLIIGVDSSGSISDKNLKKFSHVVENSMMHFKEVHLFVHDVGVHQHKIFDHQNIHLFYDFIKNEGYRGRGGTAHRYLFDEITKLWDEEKDDLSMVISLTDMYSDILECYKNYQWIKNNLPLVFLVSDSGHLLNLDPSFGDITQIKIN